MVWNQIIKLPGVGYWDFPTPLRSPNFQLWFHSLVVHNIHQHWNSHCFRTVCNSFQVWKTIFACGLALIHL